MSELPRELRLRAEATVTQLRAALAEHKSVCYASSLGPESIVLTDLIWGHVPQIEIFSIDTGRLFPETHDLIEKLQARYSRTLRMYYPDAEALESWVAGNGASMDFATAWNNGTAAAGFARCNPSGAQSLDAGPG